MKDVFNKISTKQDETLELIKKKKIEYEVTTPDIDLTVDTSDIEKVMKAEFKKQLKVLKDQAKQETGEGRELEMWRMIKKELTAIKGKVAGKQELDRMDEAIAALHQAVEVLQTEIVIAREELLKMKKNKKWWKFWV